MKYTLSIFFIILTTFSFAQTYNFKTRAISRDVIKEINILKTHDIFNDEGIGYSGYKSATYKIFEIIFEKATIQEWTELCNHPKPIIRYYAFYALKKHNITIESLMPIVINHLNDTAKIRTMYGCLGDEEVIGSFMFYSIRKEYEKSAKLKQHVDSLFLYSKGPLISEANEYLATLPKTEKLRQRLQAMVRYENNSYALDLLLSYNNPEDWISIRSLLYSHPISILKGIAKYPKQEFIKPLQWWKTHLSTPYENRETMEKLPQNPGIIWGVYKAYMNYESSIRTKYFTDIFKSNLSFDIKALHADIIYDLIKLNNETWTYPIKLTILPYLSEFNKHFIDNVSSI